LDATSFILRRLDFPLHKLRDVVDALQGAAGGRAEFELTHLSLARRLRHAGKDKTAETYAARKVAALRKAQRAAGRLLFTVVSGGEPYTDEGGAERYRRTHYVDHIMEAANWMMQRARESDLWAKHPARAIESFVDEAIELLPVADSEGGGAAGRPLSDEEFISRREAHILALAEGIYTRVAGRGGDPVQEARKIADRLTERAREVAKFQEIAADAPQICREVSDPEPPPEAENPPAAEEKPDAFAAALALAAKGWRVFPLHWMKAEGRCSCGKGAKCGSPGKHPRIVEWQRFATADKRWLKGWFKKSWPLANVGILTGETSGLYVVDVDLKSGGDVSLMELCERAGVEWPETLTVLTGSGGFHYYFQHPQGLDLRNTSAKLGPGIDTRGNGGFVVAPPSLLASGNRYAWVNDLAPAPLPESLLKLLTEEKATTSARPGGPARARGKSAPAIGAVITEGGRNETLFRIGCSMRGKGAELPEIEAELLDINARRCSPPLPESEVLKIARSAASYAPNRVAAGR